MGKPCQACNGTGKKYGAESPLAYYPCPTCGGSGISPYSVATSGQGCRVYTNDNTGDLERRVTELERELARLRLELRGVG